MALDKEAIQERISDKVEFLDNGCWVLTPRKGDRYPKLSVNNTTYKAHRVSYRVFKGKIPKNYEVHHTCENKCCVNPAHLEALSPDEHERKHSRDKSVCKHGHEIVGSNALYCSDGRVRCKTCNYKSKQRAYSYQ